MLEQSGRVISVEGHQALIETESRSSCSHCGADSCSTSVIAKLFGVKRNRLIIPNTLNAQAGQQVVLGIEDDVVVKASVMAYLLPLISMIFALAFISAITDNAFYQALASLSGLFLGMSLVGQLSSSPSSVSQHQPKMLRLSNPYIPNIDANSLLRNPQ